MDPSLVDLVLAVRIDYMQDARTHACQWGMLDGETAFKKLIEPCTSSCQAIAGCLYGGLYGGSDNRETTQNG